jgi:hypothetical protein
MPELRFSIGMATVTFSPEVHGSLQKFIADARQRH